MTFMRDTMMGSNEVAGSAADAEGYVRVNTIAQTRLTVSSFLGSICLSIFAVFLPTALHISGFDWGSLLAAIIEVLLGSASVFFLVMAAALSIVLVRLGDLNSRLGPNVRKLLSEGVSVKINNKDKDTLDNIITLYDRIYVIYYSGLVAVLLSLPFMGFHVHVVVGWAILVTYLGVFILFRKSLKFVFFYKYVPLHSSQNNLINKK